MTSVVLLEWNFSPPDYFEDQIDVSRDDYTMTIADGKVEVKVHSDIYDANPSMRKELHEGLNDRLLGVQLLTHQPYELSESMMTRVHPDGRRDIIMELGTASLVTAGASVDITVTDKDGNVISDSKRDRVERKRTLAELVATHRASDALLVSLLRSYNAAVRDPNNELVHLYEIREALSVKFGGETATRTNLAITSSRWSRLGSLSNNEPVRQGRHRGKTAAALRDATHGELTEARDIARAMLEAYLRYLESSSRTGSP